MDVAFISEATYPHYFGGVSVWCDQLVRGMSEYDFHVVNLVATGSEPTVWELPDNVASVTCIPTWGAPPGGRGPGRRALGLFSGLLADLLDVLLRRADQSPASFGDALRGLFEYAQRENLSASFTSDTAVGVLMDQWPDGHEGEPSLHDALTAL